MTPILTEFFLFSPGHGYLSKSNHNSDFQLYENNPSLEIQGEKCLLDDLQDASRNKQNGSFCVKVKP